MIHIEKKQILVVEDNRLNREILRNILSSHYQVLVAENGQEALDILAEHHESVSLILLDVVMPVMDGYTMLRRLKEDEQLALIPVIVMTQGNKEEDEITALSYGASDFLPKPYREQIILHRVASLIKLRETAAMANLYKYDQITGLYTKDYFYQKVRATLEENPDKGYVILCSNLENFKLYNDTFGREAGDHLLMEEADIFRRRVGEGAVCGRYRADRLVCLLEEEREQEVRQLLTKAFEKRHNGRMDNMSVKLGVYRIIDPSIPVEQMCDRAFLAVESIKGLYNQHIAEYNDTMRKTMLREKEITDVMEKSLRDGEFSVFYQPKYSLKDDCIIGAEALVRWNHPELGFISPGEFIPLFEKNGFIHKLDMFVWETVCNKIQEWKKNDLPMVPVSVNVSRADVYQENLSEIFEKMMERTGVNPAYLHLEITESAYTQDPERIIDTVEELRKLGFIIEMDDFGSGYSSLNMLSQMSIDILKLDMAFIRSEMTKPIERRLINDVVSMAHRMNLSVVAEGVETQNQRDRLKDMGCDYAQGYFYAKPMPEEAYEKLLLLYKEKKILSEDMFSKKKEAARNGVHEGSQDMLDKIYEVAEALPGGFFIYKADESEEIISYNKEILRIFGCENEEEFFQLTGGTFRGMVHPEDIALVESDISAQIEKENDIDTVEYRIICKDGTQKLIRDYGRFVHTDRFGDVYYVIINDITKR